jgi:hypothetical protein
MSQQVTTAGVVAVPDGGRDPDRNHGRERHRILRQLRRELERHPAIRSVRGVPDGRFRELRAEIDPAAFDRDAASATLRVAWWPAPEDPEFVFHYSESTGFDCGWHREVNPDVEGMAHYQERGGLDEAYESEAVELPTLVPTRLCWTILERLEDRLRAE